MSAIRTARERARAELTREIKEEARRQLAAAGAHGLSLRAVARELGMVSSALYRYFPSRDELLTALIIDAYDAIGERAEGAVRDADPADPRAQWIAFAHGVRDWAIAHPHEYALVYGSPVPGYQAPEATIAPASRVPLTLVGIVRKAWESGGMTAPDDELSPELGDQAARLAELTAAGVPGPITARTVVVWTQLFGMVSFELFGQLVGSMDPTGPFFAYALDRMADFLGLPRQPSDGP